MRLSSPVHRGNASPTSSSHGQLLYRSILAPKLAGSLYPKATVDACDVTERDDDELSTERSASLRCSDGMSGSIFIPRDSVVHLQIKELKRSFPLASRRVRYLSIHAGNDESLVEPQGYVQYLHVRGGDNAAFVLLDEHQEPIALCRPDDPTRGRQPQRIGTVPVTFYSRRPLLTCDNHDVHAVVHDGAMFYPWLRVSKPFDCRAPPVFHVWNGGSFQNDARFSASTYESTCEIGAEVASSDGTESLWGGMGNVTSVTASGSNASKRSFRERQCRRWNVSVRPLADPAMMICLTVAMGRLVP